MQVSVVSGNRLFLINCESLIPYSDKRVSIRIKKITKEQRGTTFKGDFMTSWTENKVKNETYRSKIKRN